MSASEMFVPLQAVQATRSVCGFSSKIEVECGSTEEAIEAAHAGADIVMLDNLKPQVSPRALDAAQFLILMTITKVLHCVFSRSSMRPRSF